MSASSRFALFLSVTIIGVGISHYAGWMMYGPLASMAVLAVLYSTYAWMARRFGSDRAQVIPSAVLWSLFATLCVFGGGLVGMMAYNPDGYMQPKPRGAPWQLIFLGTGLGAVAGVVVVGLLRLVERTLEPPKP